MVGVMQHVKEELSAHALEPSFVKCDQKSRTSSLRARHPPTSKPAPSHQARGHSNFKLPAPTITKTCRSSLPSPEGRRISGLPTKEPEAENPRSPAGSCNRAAWGMTNAPMSMVFTSMTRKSNILPSPLHSKVVGRWRTPVLRFGTCAHLVLGRSWKGTKEDGRLAAI